MGWGAKKTSREFELGYGSEGGGEMIGDEDGMLKKQKMWGKGPMIDSEVYISAQ